MSEKSALRIHTAFTPGEPPASIPSKPQKRQKGPRFHPRFRSARSRRLTQGERLLRNSAVACAVLLAVLALDNVDQPWARKAVGGIQRALTMHIDLDESLGELTFVRRIMPESALVFLNASGKTGQETPVEGEIQHPWSASQPWTVFECGRDAPVSAVAAGTVTAVSELSSGKQGLLIDHGGGYESLYANLTRLSVESGDAVSPGQSLGVCDEDLFFEYRCGGESIDPAVLWAVQ